MTYDHTQHGPLHYIMIVVVAILFVSAWFCRGVPPLATVYVGVAFLLLFVSAMFHYLTVSDEGDWLAVRFGPISLFSKRIPYSQMTAVEPDRSSILDGWGIHYMPGKGVIYNLWGFDCVRISLGKKTIRVGTDDIDGLVSFLRGKIGQNERM